MLNYCMPEKVIRGDSIYGLPLQQVSLLRRQYGENVFTTSSRGFIPIAWNIFKEPMFILLIIACGLYFILGELAEGAMMLVAMILVSAISIYQEVKSSNALKALQQFTQPKVAVVREGREVVINTRELVPGDIMLLNEGMNVPTDALILQENDLTINESVLTGESLPVAKHQTKGHNEIFQGTTINSGKCIAQVKVTGNNTVLGKLGKSVSAYQPPKTLLQLQINSLVSRLALFGLIGFFIIFFVHFLDRREWASSLLFALTLAMSAVPEEIPVAFSSFMALGAYKMSKLGIITRQAQVVESLGAVSVICLDKTGTITKNVMVLKSIYNYENDTLIDLSENIVPKNDNVLWYGVLASEIHPFDAMEKAIWEAYVLSRNGKDQEKLNMIFEYPLQGQLQMMTHVYDYNGTKVVAAKGAAERIIEVCKPRDEEKNAIIGHVKLLASNGYRVLGVASAIHTEQQFPAMQDDFEWRFEGLLAFYDPPKKNIPEVLQQFHNAQIVVKLITGDYTETAINIAGQVGIRDHLKCITGEQVINLKEPDLMQVVENTNVFARMFPDAKRKVIDALKANGEIVAMTGDGVNDGPALKSANIGIAIGAKGTEIARQAADLIITDDNLERMVAAISEGRKIFSNFKKAVSYIISIHIPIILTASLPVIFGWDYPNIFTPIHVIFMELIMGPTCSIFFEREPVEENIMQQAPREKSKGIFTSGELRLSIMQGMIIAAGSLLLYYYFMSRGAGLEVTRTIVFTGLILSNILLTFASRSFTKTIYHTARYHNTLAPGVIVVSVFFLFALHYVPAIRTVFLLSTISLSQFLFCFSVALVGVMWVEVYKAFFLKTQ